MNPTTQSIIMTTIELLSAGLICIGVLYAIARLRTIIRPTRRLSIDEVGAIPLDSQSEYQEITDED